MNTNEFYNKKGLEARKLRKDEVDEFAINLRLKWKDQEFTRIADKIWRSTGLRTLLNFTPQVGSLEDEDRVLPVKEINKWCKRSMQLFNREQIVEQYFSIFQRDPENAIEDWSPYRTYLPGELVQYVPEINTDIWRLEDEFEMRGGKIFNKQTNTSVRPQDAKWKVYSEIKGKEKPVEIQPPVLVSYEAFQTEILDLSTMSHCYWMCLQHIVGEDRVSVKRNLNETESNFALRVVAQERTDREAVIDKKLEPRLDYLHMDQKWIPLDRKKGIQDLLKGRGWPGSEYWVCLHFPGTGQIVTESRPGRQMPVQELRISHQQVWYARAAFLSRLTQIHSSVPKLLNKYNKGTYLEKEEEHLRRKVLNAFSEIDRYTNDLNDLGTVTIGRAMDVVASDMVNNAHKEKYQIFYRKDFQNVIDRVDGVARTSDEDVWGKLKYIAAGAKMRYGHGAVKAMEAVFANQGLSDHETYIRRVKPKQDQDDLGDPVESVQRHWDERAQMWEKLFDYFHKPLIEWQKMHYQFKHSSDVQLNRRLGIDKERLHELVKKIYVINSGYPFPQIPTTDSWFILKNSETRKKMDIVDEAREFFSEGLKFFKMAYEEEKEYLRINPIGPSSTDEDKKMVFSMLRYRPAGEHGWMIRYILQCLYNGASNTESGALHNVGTDGANFFDWGTRIRKLFFKFTMFYGLLRYRNVIGENKEFEHIYNNWSTIRIRTFKKQNISLKAYTTIWEQGEEALKNARDNAIWQIDIFQTDGPQDGRWEAFAAHPLKEYINNQTIEIRPNVVQDTPLLFKTKKSLYWENKFGVDQGETVRWRKMLEWWFIYMRKLDMAAIDDTWSEGTSVYQACAELRKKHIRFLVAYLPEYRVYTDKLYGSMVFGRLEPRARDYDGAVLHVVAYCERLKLENDTLEKVNEDLTCMQWTVNGFNEEDNITVWLSGTKNILTQTITKNPINLYGPSALTPAQEAALKDIYDSTGDHVRKDHEDAIRDYNELRAQQEKEQEALMAMAKDEEDKEEDLEKLKKNKSALEEKLRSTIELINNIKAKAVANPVDGD